MSSVSRKCFLVPRVQTERVQNYCYASVILIVMMVLEFLMSLISVTQLHVKVKFHVRKNFPIHCTSLSWIFLRLCLKTLSHFLDLDLFLHSHFSADLQLGNMEYCFVCSLFCCCFCLGIFVTPLDIKTTKIDEAIFRNK